MDDIAEKIQALLSDEESMNQIKELAAMFSGSGDESSGNGTSESNADNGEQAPQNGDPGESGLNINPMAIIRLMSAVSQKDKDCDLLLALRPHLSPEKQSRIDKAVKLLKLYNIFITLRENGMLNDLENML